MRHAPRVRAWVMVVALVLLVVLWFFRTWWHSPVMWLYATPSLLEAILVWWLLHRFVLRRVARLTRVHAIRWKDQGSVWKTSQFRWLWWVSGAVGVSLMILLPVASMWLRHAELARITPYHPIQRLPESAEQIRVMPVEVAARFARDSLQTPQYVPGRYALAPVDGRLSWEFLLVPSAPIIKFTLPAGGVAVVDATTQEKNTRLIQRPLRPADGIHLTDNFWWQAYRRRYFVSGEKPYYVMAPDEGIWTVAPAISWHHRLAWGIWYTVPHFAGAFVASPQGEMAFLGPEAVAQHPVAGGTRAFPEQLARWLAEAYAFRQGIPNALFIHQDQVKVTDVRREEGALANRQPFLMTTREGLKWFISAEPYGQSRGIFKVFLVDAASGQVNVLHLPADETLTGPTRAIDYVRRANPLVDWSGFEIIEPLPFVRNGVLYWKVVVMPNDAAGIAYQAFVDSRTSRVYAVTTDEDMSRFLARGPAGLGTGTATGAGAAATPQIAELQQLLQEIRQRLDQVEARLGTLGPSRESPRQAPLGR